MFKNRMKSPSTTFHDAYIQWSGLGSKSVNLLVTNSENKYCIFYDYRLYINKWLLLSFCFLLLLLLFNIYPKGALVFLCFAIALHFYGRLFQLFLFPRERPSVHTCTEALTLTIPLNW